MGKISDGRGDIYSRRCIPIGIPHIATSVLGASYGLPHMVYLEVRGVPRWPSSAKEPGVPRHTCRGVSLVEDPSSNKRAYIPRPYRGPEERFVPGMKEIKILAPCLLCRG